MLDKLDGKEKDEVWSMLICLLKKGIADDASSEDNPQLLNCIELLHELLRSKDNIIENEIGFVNILKYLTSDEFVVASNAVKNSLSKLYEYWIAKKQTPQEIPGMEYFTLKHLLGLCSVGKPLVSNIFYKVVFYEYSNSNRAYNL